MSRVGEITQVYSAKMSGLSARGRNPDKDPDVRNSFNAKETDTTVFSRRENLRKGDTKSRGDSLLKNRSHMKQSNGGNDSYIFHLDQSSQLELDKFVYSHSNRNAQIMPISNKINLFQGTTNMQNGFDFNLNLSQERSTIGKSLNDQVGPGIKRREFEENGNFPRKITDDAVGDDEPLFPIILNKRELTKNDKGNLSYHQRESSLDNKKNARSFVGQYQVQHPEETEKILNQKKALNPKKGSVGPAHKNVKNRPRRGNSEDHKPLKKKQSLEYEHTSTIHKPEKSKVNLRHILQQLASYLDNTQEPDPNSLEAHEDDGGKSLENSKLNIKKSRSKQVARNPSQKPKVFPNLSQKDGPPQSFDMVHYKNKTYFLAQKVGAKPRYLDALKKPSQTSSLVEGINSMSQVSSLHKKPSIIENTMKRQTTSTNTGKNYIENNRRIISNLLKPISNGPRNYLKSQASVLKDRSARHIRSESNHSAQSSRSRLFSVSGTPKNKNSQRSFRFKADHFHIDNNNLVRELYRVKDSSRKSLRSEGDLLSEKKIRQNNSFLDEESHVEQSSKVDINETINHQGDNFLSVPKDHHKEGTISKEESNRMIEHTSTLLNPMINKHYTPNNSQYLDEVPDRLSAFLENSFTNKRRSPIEKFGKEWEEQKKRIEKGALKDTPVIQFTSNNENTVKGKSFIFEKTERMSPFLYKDLAPGPGKYKVSSSTIKGFSFGKEKRADLTELPVLQDVNKMLDPIRHIKYE